jgi:hypothetical protein
MAGQETGVEIMTRSFVVALFLTVAAFAAGASAGEPYENEKRDWLKYHEERMQRIADLVAERDHELEMLTEKAEYYRNNKPKGYEHDVARISVQAEKLVAKTFDVRPAKQLYFDLGGMKKGDFGFSFYKNMEVFQVIDENNLIIKLAAGDAWVEMPTEGMVDNAIANFSKTAFYCTGTKRYNSLAGARTVAHVVAVPFSIPEFEPKQKSFPERAPYPRDHVAPAPSKPTLTTVHEKRASGSYKTITVGKTPSANDAAKVATTDDLAKLVREGQIYVFDSPTRVVTEGQPTKYGIWGRPTEGPHKGKLMIFDSGKLAP